MNRILKPAVLSLAAVSIAMTPIAQASAHERWNKHRHPRHQTPVVVEKRDTGELLAAGIIGLALGAIIVGAANTPDDGGGYVHHPARPRPDRDYFPPRPDVAADDPEIVYYEGSKANAAEPWSAEWYRDCSARYRSFDARSGTFMGFDGKRHFCIAN